MKRKYMTLAQTNYIQGHLKLRGEDTVTLAKKLGLPWSTVASAINGYRANMAARQAIAAFLGEPVEKLFGEPGETPGAGGDAAGASGAATEASSHG
jgi:hypothetical protein